MPNTAHLRNLIAENRLDEVFNELLLSTQANPTWRSAYILNKNRWEELSRQKIMGVLSFDDENRRRNQIVAALLELIDKIEKGETAVTITVGNTVNPPDSPVSNDNGSNNSDGKSSHVPWIVGLGLLLAGVGLLVADECPSETKFFGIRLLLALGAGGVASILPGLFKFDSPGVVATGALAMAALVYLVNPAKLIASDDCGKLPFEFTVSLQPDPALKLSPGYPPMKDARLLLRLDNKWEPAGVDDLGDADYKSIPGDFKNRKVAARLDARFWKLAADSLRLENKSQTLFLLPDSSLGELAGKVKTGEEATPLEGVVVEIEGVKDTTDGQGNFRLLIPMEQQKGEYDLSAGKKGFSPLTQKVVAGRNLDLRLEPVRK
ncbi:MAG: hypothetical protein EPO28_04195 [Saprospiraceae bacterium]|nr:MAG: hypothetical protein EPO28_04195 [Saprospiraceae bacterium]